MLNFVALLPGQFLIMHEQIALLLDDV